MSEAWTLADVKALPEAIARYAADTPGKVCFTWLEHNGATHLTYAELWSRAGTVAHRLRTDWGAKRGDAVLLVYIPGPEFLVAFLGCLMAGCAAVPTYPPIPQDLARSVARLSRIVDLTGAQIVLTDTRYQTLRQALVLRSRISSHPISWPSGVKWYATNSRSARRAPSRPYLVEPYEAEDVAFVQFTSGSTGDPKGAVIRHRSLAANLYALATQSDSTPDDCGIAWVPMYHDLGLIAVALHALFCGGQAIMMSPIDFLRSPIIWLKAISDHPGPSLTVAPNFAYALCNRKITAAQRATLDLSRCRAFANAAEPVRIETMRSFLDLFGECGVVTEHMKTVYGLAESTVFVSGVQRAPITVLHVEHGVSIGNPIKVLSESSLKSTKQASEEELQLESNRLVKTILSCNAPDRACAMVIVDPDSCNHLPSDHVGEIWICSPSLAKEYIRDPERSAAVFGAQLADDVSRPRRKFLRTGDLGFLHNGEVYICGRIKNLLILNGRNYYPHDIEDTCYQTEDRIRPGCAAVFSTEDEVAQTEALIVVAELRDESSPRGEIARNLRAAIARVHGLQASDIVLIKPRALPKTTSGKPRHFECRQKYLDNKLPVLYSLRLHAFSHGQQATLKKSENARSRAADGTISSADPDESTQEPASSTVSQVAEDVGDIFVRVLELPPLPLSPSLILSDLGIPSIKAAELLSELSEYAGQPLEPDFLEKHTQFDDVVVALEEITRGREFQAQKVFPDVHLPEIPHLSSRTVGSTGMFCLQTLGIIYMLLLVTAAVLPAFHFGKYVLEHLDEPWSRFKLFRDASGYGVLMPLLLPIWMTCFSVGVIFTKWVVVGRFRVGEASRHSLVFFRWWLVTRLFDLWGTFVGIFLIDTVLMNLFYSLCGAKVAWTARLHSPCIRDCDLVRVGPDASVSSLLQPSAMSADSISFRPISVGQGAKVKSLTTISPGCTVADGSYVAAGASLAAGATTKPDFLYEGTPAFQSRVQLFVDARTAEKDEESGSLSSASTRSSFKTGVFALSKLLALFLSLYIFFYTSCVSLVLWELIGIPDFRYAALLFWVTSYFITGVCVCILAILFKWLLLGRVRPGVVTPSLWTDLCSFIVANHQRVVFLLLVRWFDETEFVWLWLRAYGFQIGSGVQCVASYVFPAERADLISIGSHSFISNCHFVVDDDRRSDGRVERTRITLARGVEIGLHAVVGPNATMEEDSGLAATTELRHDTVRAGKIRLFLAESRKDIVAAEDALLDASNFQWVFSLFCLVVHIVALIPAYEIAVHLLYDNPRDFFPVLTSGQAQVGPVNRNVAILLLAVSLLTVLVCFALIMALLNRVMWRFWFTFGDFADVVPRLARFYGAYQGVTSVNMFFFTSVLYGTRWHNLYLSLLGSRVSPSAYVGSRLAFEHPLLSIRSNAVVEEGVRVLGHMYARVRGGLIFDRTVVGANAVLERNSTLFAGAAVSPGERVICGSMITRGSENLHANSRIPSSAPLMVPNKIARTSLV
eukprot:m.53573 g.53573  ORF g.53573 m.53573 type:complete len:1500 (+) comp6776_c0_seq1:136-4635(+)